ncbi:DUF2569 family protein [Micromonospora sp. BL4]|nr:DUF2569 family protein [Micromonospora sp. BL4]
MPSQRCRIPEPQGGAGGTVCAGSSATLAGRVGLARHRIRGSAPSCARAPAPTVKPVTPVEQPSGQGSLHRQSTDNDAPQVPARSSALRLGGLLAGYVVVLVLLLIHGIGLTIATLVIDANPSLVGMTELGPESHIVFYVVTNCLLAVYTVVLLWLICTRRRAAIVHNYLYCAISIGCLVAWNVLGMKSPIGTVIDSLPGIVGIVYFANSTRVKRTLRRPLP